jgi:hypothetical protein
MNSKRHWTLARNTRSVWILSLPWVLGAAASCSSTPLPSSLAAGCSIDSDCDGNLICTFGRCHEQCMTSKDCKGATCLAASGGNVCELEQEVACSGTLPCVVGLTCANDICRAPCSPGSSVGTTGGCLEDQTCVAGSMKDQFVCIDGSGDAGKVDGGSEAGKKDAGGEAGKPDGRSTSDATMSDTKGDSPNHDGGSDADATSSCPNSATQFGGTAYGDSNPNFTSGVGARTATDLLIFDGYNGPDPAGDGGGTAVALVYVQDFDAKTAKSKGPAQRLFVAPTLGVNTAPSVGVILYSTAVAPSGDMALVYGVHYSNDPQVVFYAAFLGLSADAGSGSEAGVQGLELEDVVLLETALSTSVGGDGQPFAIWSDTLQAFVLSWEYIDSQNYVQVSNYLVGGDPAGGGAEPVPTNDDGQVQHGGGSEVNGSVGESKNLFGVGYIDEESVDPALTILDPSGNQVGKSFDVVPTLPKINSNWVAVGGTSNGFVYFYDNAQTNTVSEAFVPISADGGVVGGFSDGGGDGGFPGFSFPGAMRASAARAIADGPGGSGGVGIALLYQNGVSFAYVNADGVTHVGPSSLFVHDLAGSDEVSLTNVAGSFVVSLYDSAAQSTQVVASGCQ